MDEPAADSKPKAHRPRGTGSIYKPKDSPYWWIAYMSGGKRHFESSRKRDKDEAQAVLSIKQGDIAKGVPVTAEIGKKTLAQGLQAVVDDLSINGRQSAKEVERQIELHILTHFPKNRRMSEITTSQLSAYVKHRKDQGTAPASCNGDLAIIRRAYKLAMRAGELLGMPYIPMLTLNNARQGFFEQHELDEVLQHLPDWAKAPIRFAHVTAWRLHSEVLPLTAAQVDLKVGVVRLEVGTTKNRDGRTFYVTEDLRRLLRAQLAALEALRDAGTICPYVFHKPGGIRIKNLRQVWEQARKEAGYPGKWMHDLRRTGVRNLERAGVPRSTAMKMVGHKTEAMYRRYAIQDEAMLREGAAKLDAWTAEQRAKANAERRGQLRRFRK